MTTVKVTRIKVTRVKVTRVKVTRVKVTRVKGIAMTLPVGEMADSVPVLKKMVEPVNVDTSGTVKQCRERRMSQYP